MFKDKPVKYDDPFWVERAREAEAKVGLPGGLLEAILVHGEKTNADRVSPAGARTPFQIIPQTRKGAINNYGIDPYLSPENAAEVAARLLKDSLDRNNGDVEQAVGEYHGGLNRKAWGPVNKAYRKRVLSGLSSVGQASSSQDVMNANIAGIRSPEEILSGQRERVLGFGKQEPQLQEQNPFVLPREVVEAYNSGAMAPEDAAELEADLAAGAVSMPEGLTLSKPEAPQADAEPQPTPAQVPESVFDAYASGVMDDAAAAELEADAESGAVQLPSELRQARQVAKQAANAGRVGFTDDGVRLITEDEESRYRSGELSNEQKLAMDRALASGQAVFKSQHVDVSGVSKRVSHTAKVGMLGALKGLAGIADLVALGKQKLGFDTQGGFTEGLEQRAARTNFGQPRTRAEEIFQTAAEYGTPTPIPGLSLVAKGASTGAKIASEIIPAAGAGAGAAIADAGGLGETGQSIGAIAGAVLSPGHAGKAVVKSVAEDAGDAIKARLGAKPELATPEPKGVVNTDPFTTSEVIADLSKAGTALTEGGRINAVKRYFEVQSKDVKAALKRMKLHGVDIEDAISPMALAASESVRSATATLSAASTALDTMHTSMFQAVTSAGERILNTLTARVKPDENIGLLLDKELAGRFSKQMDDYKAAADQLYASVGDKVSKTMYTKLPNVRQEFERGLNKAQVLELHKKFPEVSDLLRQAKAGKILNFDWLNTNARIQLDEAFSRAESPLHKEKLAGIKKAFDQDMMDLVRGAGSDEAALDLARALSISSDRYLMRDSVQALFGRDFAAALMKASDGAADSVKKLDPSARVVSSLRQLADGKASEFDNIVKNIPDDLRADFVAEGFSAAFRNAITPGVGVANFNSMSALFGRIFRNKEGFNRIAPIIGSDKARLLRSLSVVFERMSAVHKALVSSRGGTRVSGEMHAARSLGTKFLQSSQRFLTTLITIGATGVGAMSGSTVATMASAAGGAAVGRMLENTAVGAASRQRMVAVAGDVIASPKFREVIEASSNPKAKAAAIDSLITKLAKSEKMQELGKLLGTTDEQALANFIRVSIIGEANRGADDNPAEAVE